MRVMWWFLLSALGVPILFLVWAVGIEPRLIVEESEQVPIPALPPEWEGRRIALIADPQIGMWMANTGTVRRVIARLIEMRPAAVLIAGDFLYHAVEKKKQMSRDAGEPETIGELLDIMRPLPAAGVPTYAVLGNHDYRFQAGNAPVLPGLAAMLREKLEGIGVHVLQNEASPLPLPEGEGEASGLWLVGIGPRLPQQGEPRDAFAEVPEGAPRIVLMHNPGSFKKLPPGSAPLALAGHTHGGQVRFPWQALRRLLGRVNEERPELSGWIHHYGEAGNRLYINRGLGFSRLPMRFNSPPEITIFNLSRSPAIRLQD